MKNTSIIAFVLISNVFFATSQAAFFFNPLDSITKQNIALIKGIINFFDFSEDDDDVPSDLFVSHSSPKKNGLPINNPALTNQPPASTDQQNIVTFDDIAGSQQILDEIKGVIACIKERKKYASLGAKLPKGILLQGAPGTGKTLIAKAISHEAGCKFFYESGSAFIEKYVGVGAQRIRKLFEQAAANKPAIIFIDEIDAIAANRDDNSERRQTLNQLLTLMDGFDSHNEIMVIGATNFFNLDPAATRAGRFDRVITVPLPNNQSRKEILSLYINRLPAVKIDPTYIDTLVQQTEGLNGADLSNLVNQAAFAAANENATVVIQGHFEQSLQKTLKERHR